MQQIFHVMIYLPVSPLQERMREWKGFQISKSCNIFPVTGLHHLQHPPILFSSLTAMRAHHILALPLAQMSV